MTGTGPTGTGPTDTGPTDTVTTSESERFWEDFYGDGVRTWSGTPNQLLVEEVEALAPATVLDLGCGTGGDAIWLASRGWGVTAVDVSANALHRAARAAAAAGVGGAIRWERHELGISFPSGTFDLVSAHYLHSPVQMPRATVLRMAARAVAPHGTLLIVGHAGSPSWADADHEMACPTLQEVLDDLELAPGRWEVLRSEVVSVPVTDPDGEPATRPDSVLHLARIDDPG